MARLSDIIDNLRDTGNAYSGHKNTGEFNAVITQLQDFVDNKDRTIQFRPDQTRNLEEALTKYLNHTGMDTAWHEKGNIRKENVLAALNLINPDKAKEYEQQANSVRRASKKIDLNTLMEKDTVKRDPNKKRNGNLPREDKNPSRDIEGPHPAPVAPKKGK